MAYNGSIDLISGIRQKNNGDFPLVDAKDVRVTDQQRLDAALAEKMPAASALPKPEEAGEAGQVLKNGEDGATVWGTIGADEVTVTEGKKLDAVLNEKADAADVIPKPETAGTEGQHLQIDAEGNPVWVDPGTPTDTQVGEAVDAWLDAHPEATTTVQDGTITRAKLDDDLKEKTDEVSELKSALHDLYDNSATVTMTDGYMIERLMTSPVVNAESAVTDFVPVKPGQKVRFRNVFLRGTRAINAYQNTTTLTATGTLVYGTEDTEVLLTMPNDAYFVRATAQIGETVDITYVDPIQDEFDKIEADMQQGFDDIQAQIPAVDSGLTVSGDAADAKVTGDNIRDLQNALMIDISEQSLWSSGSISSATGYVSASTQRLVSAPLPLSASRITPADGYKYRIAAYDDGTYIGMWDGSAFVKSATDITSETDLALLGAHTYRLVFARNDDGTIDVDSYDKIKIMEVSDSTLEKRCFAADAYAVGQKFDSLENVVSPISQNAKVIPLAMHEYEFPSAFDAVSPVHVYTDGCHYITDFDAEDHKNTGGVTYYVGPGGTGASTDPTVPGAFAATLTASANGDTIIIQPGTYNRDDPAYPVRNPITKSINIIASDGAVFLDGNFMTYTKTSGYTNVYNCDRTLTSRIIDVSIEGQYIPYTAVSSIAEVDATPGTYYFSTPTVYVHALDGGDPTGKIINCLDYEMFLDINNSNGDVHVYVEGITLVGKKQGILINRAVPENDLDVCFNGVNAVLCGDELTEKDTFMVYGGDVIFNKCKAISSYKDGYNYSGRNMAGTTCDCFVTEIDCVGAGCGHEASSASQNGTTAHQNAKVIRINGKYFDCNGGNVADVQTGTQSVNIGCIAYAPYTDGGYSQNFTLQQDGAEMWLEGCIAAGAKYDIFCANNATIHANNTAYETKSIYQQGVFDETHVQSVMGLALKRGMVFGID